MINAEDATIPPCLYHPEDFYFQEIDLEQQRSIVSPRTAVFMPNSNCTTDCVYIVMQTDHQDINRWRLSKLVQLSGNAKT